MDEVHLWSIPLVGDAVLLQREWELLDEQERARAERFHFERDRNRFVLAHAGLRRILSQYVRTSPASIRFELGPYGKPELAVNVAEQPWRFNLSHAHELGLCAVRRGGRVGVDVEQVRAEAWESVSIAQQFFTAGETALVLAALEETRAETFLKLWTRKEAYLKGHGKGLSMPLNEFAVSLEETCIRYPLEKGGEERNWSVHELHPAEGYIGAVALEGAGEFAFVEKRLEPGG
jgi:4'-phosphopantetheinyl transferase